MKKLLLLITLLLLFTTPDTLLSQETWIKTFDYGHAEKVYDIVPSYDGNFWIVGETKGQNEISRILFIKISPLGEEVLARITASQISLAGKKGIEIPDSTLLILGTVTHSEKSGLLVSVHNAKEDILPWNEYQHDHSLTAQDIIETSDNGFLLIGAADTTSVLFKLDSNLKILWKIEVLGLFNTAIETDDNGFILVGTRKFQSDILGSYYQGHVTLIDSMQNIVWSLCPGSNLDNCTGIERLSNGNYLIAGSSDFDVLIGSGFIGGIKIAEIDLLGNLLWLKAKYSVFTTKCSNFISTQSGDFITTGAIDCQLYSGDNIFISKTDQNGNIIWQRSFADSLNQVGNATTELPDGSLISVGTRYSKDNTTSDIVVIRMDSEGQVTSINDHGHVIQPEDFRLHQNYPNPFNPETRIRFEIPASSFVSITIFDLLGKTVKTLTHEFLPAGSHKVTWDGTNYQGQKVSSGMYFYRIQAGDFYATKKMLLIK